MFAKTLLKITLAAAQLALGGAALARDGGALAVVPQHGRDLHGYSSAGSAAQNRKAALRKCGDRRCKIVQEYRKGQCAVLVLGQGQIFWNGGSGAELSKRQPREAMRKSLLAHCERIDDGCSIILNECY